MPENMSISVNGQTQVPPGFRFHPTEEELLQYYLRKKISCKKIDLDVIRDVDLNKLEPWDIEERCKIGAPPQSDWYFFSHKDKKYPTGTRTNRATAAGFWKATGRDKVIYSNRRRIGLRKTLVFYKGRAPHGQKSDWIMHEYRLEDDCLSDANATSCAGETALEEGWVVCRVFKKKNQYKALEGRIINANMAVDTRTLTASSTNGEGPFDQLLHCMGSAFTNDKEAHKKGMFHARTKKLPSLESPNSTINQECCYQLLNSDQTFKDLENESSTITNPAYGSFDMIHRIDTSITNWAAFDQLVASQLNAQNETSWQLSYFNGPINHDIHLPQLKSSSNRPNPYASLDYNTDVSLWNFPRSSSLSASDAI